MFWLEVPDRIFARSLVRDDTEARYHANDSVPRLGLQSGSHFLESAARRSAVRFGRSHASSNVVKVISSDAERLYRGGSHRSFARAFSRLAFRTAQRSFAQPRAAPGSHRATRSAARTERRKPRASYGRTSAAAKSWAASLLPRYVPRSISAYIKSVGAGAQLHCLRTIKLAGCVDKQFNAFTLPI
jgi:hypothetical protein